MPESKWIKLLQFISHCKHLTCLSFEDITMEQIGHHLAKSITSWGDNPPLQILNLKNCYKSAKYCVTLLQSLSICKSLTELYLNGNTIGGAGPQLAESITSWGENPPLQILDLTYCSIRKEYCAKLLQSLSTCKSLTKLYLNGNTIGAAGHHLAESITSWGDNPPLKILDLESCSIPEECCAKLLQSLSRCKCLTELYLSNNSIGEAGHHLAESIMLWGANPRLRVLSVEKLFSVR